MRTIALGGVLIRWNLNRRLDRYRSTRFKDEISDSKGRVWRSEGRRDWSTLRASCVLRARDKRGSLR